MTTTLETSSAVESSMEDEDAFRARTKPRASNNTPSDKMNNHRHGRSKGDEANCGDGQHGDDAEAVDEDCDLEVWETLSKSFRQVQSVLDRNRALIREVNENHKSRVHDNLVKNVGLIREINCNVSKVISIYSDLSINFSDIVHKRRAIKLPDNIDDNNVAGS